MIDVILETGDNRRSMAAKVLEGLGDDFIARIKDAGNIFIKVDLGHHDRQYLSTHVDTVRGVLDILTYHSRCTIIIGDGSYFGTGVAFHQLGYERLLEEYEKIELVDLNETEVIDGEIVQRDGSGRTVKRSQIARLADVSIAISSIKTDTDFGLLASIYHWSVGTWIVPSRISSQGRVWARWPWIQEEGAWAQHASIVALFEQNKPDYAIVDAGYVVQIGEGVIKPIPLGLMLAAYDLVALDSVCATLIGLDPSDIGYLSMAYEKGLGSINMAQINIPPMQLMQYKKDLSFSTEFRENLRKWAGERPDVKIELS